MTKEQRRSPSSSCPKPTDLLGDQRARTVPIPKWRENGNSTASMVQAVLESQPCVQPDIEVCIERRLLLLNTASTYEIFWQKSSVCLSHSRRDTEET
jgi:hypothetical protein